MAQTLFTDVHADTGVRTGVLWRGDNLDRLADSDTFPDESVDLIYLDPPFFSNRKYEVIWGDEAEVRSFEDRWEGGIGNYIDWMRKRVVHLHRILKPTGVVYLHCDPHASHYLKVMLDDVFGTSGFLNEIIWKRTGAHGSARRYAPVHDTILFYGGSKRHLWNKQYHPYREEYLTDKYKYTDERGTYRLITLVPPGVRNGESGQPWRGIDPTPRGLHWTYRPSKLDELDSEGMIYWGKDNQGLPQLKRYLDLREGIPIQDVWTDIAPLNSRARERLGYPTQKPEVLLERIIQASSNPGDVVLDPFCGCGTTVVVAERLNRRWVGIDISPTAIEIMKQRLGRTGCRPIIANPVDSIAELKRLSPFEFQNWIIKAIHGDHATRKTGDMGIDGYWFLTRDPVQVKQSEHVGRNVVDNFETAVRREGRATGYIIAFSFTRGAVDEAVRAKADGLDIRLIRASEVLLLVRRPGTEKIGPQPPSEVEAPISRLRKREDLPTAEELVESARRTAAAG